MTPGVAAQREAASREPAPDPDPPSTLDPRPSTPDPRPSTPDPRPCPRDFTTGLRRPTAALPDLNTKTRRRRRTGADDHRSSLVHVLDVLDVLVVPSAPDPGLHHGGAEDTENGTKSLPAEHADARESDQEAGVEFGQGEDECRTSSTDYTDCTDKTKPVLTQRRKDAKCRPRFGAFPLGAWRLFRISGFELRISPPLPLPALSAPAVRQTISRKAAKTPSRKGDQPRITRINANPIKNRHQGSDRRRDRPAERANGCE